MRRTEATVGRSFPTLVGMEWLVPLIVVVVLVVILGIYLWATYNSLVTLNVLR